MSQSGHFYSCMGLKTRDIGFPRVDRQRDTPGFGASQLPLHILIRF